MNPNKKNAENAEKFSCESCGFICSKQSNYIKHISTNKHKILTNPNFLVTKNATQIFECGICKKIYKHASTLSSHKKKCSAQEKNNSSDTKLLSELVIELVKSNNDLQKQLLDTLKNNNNNNVNYINSNNNNKTFNLQFFLNEQCKDAMNIMDFVNSVTLQLSDLESVGKLGYVEGISNIIVKKLNEMDVYKRPVHCSDAKREILYVKDNNIWEKENATHSKLRRAIKYISKKNSDLLLAWSNQHPASKNIHSKQNEEYMKMIYQAMGGTGEVEENENKIIKKISKMVLIEKN
jgi:uncharacterized C2H2 Zn-finger protein